MAYEVEALADRCRAVLGDPDRWFKPDGYPNSLALCIVDSIFSTGSHYQAVINVVRRYRDLRGPAAETDGTAELLSTFADHDGARGWAEHMKNRKPASTRPGASLKAAVVEQVAINLDEAGVCTTADLRQRADPTYEQTSRATKALWTSAEAQSSGITWEYALILAGLPRVKADRMVIRFVTEATGASTIDPTQAAQLVVAGQEVVDVSRGWLVAQLHWFHADAAAISRPPAGIWPRGLRRAVVAQ